MNKQQFIQELEKIHVFLTEKQLDLLEIYQQILMEYNTHTNLTAIKDKEGIYLKHFYDSLTIQEYIKDKKFILDIGTGAGFPGMVLAIANPNIHFVLLDSNNKKINFLAYLNEKLNLKNVEFINQRAEEYVKLNLERFDIVTSRAVASLRILAELSLPALKIGGLFIPMKSNMEEELKESLDTISILGGTMICEKKFQLPIENSQRTILIIEHTNKTNSIYPRSYDKILKKPLKK